MEPAQPAASPQINSRLQHFRNLTPAARLEALAQATGLDAADVATLGQAGALTTARANGMVENVCCSA